MLTLSLDFGQQNGWQGGGWCLKIRDWISGGQRDVGLESMTRSSSDMMIVKRRAGHEKVLRPECNATRLRYDRTIHLTRLSLDELDLTNGDCFRRH